MAILLSKLTLAQTTFEQVFLATQGTLDLESCYKTIELPNGNFVSIGLNDGCTFCQTNYYVRCSDPQGTLLWQHVYVPGQVGVTPDICLTTDGHIVFIIGNVSPLPDMSNDAQIFFLKFDYSGNTLLNRNYHFNYPFEVYPSYTRIFQMADSSLVFTSSKHLAKLNNNLDSLNSKNYGSGYMRPFISTDKSKIKTVQIYQINSRDTALLTTYDSNLDSLITKAFPLSVYTYFLPVINWGPGYIHEAPTESILFNAANIPGLDSIAFVCLDSNMNLEWVRYYSNVRYTVGGEFDTDSNSVIFSGRTDTAFISHGPAFLYKFNLNGDSIFFKTIQAKNIYDETRIYDVKYSSTGYMISGYAKSDSTGQQSYVAVTDTSGNFTTRISRTLQSDLIKVGGNPTTGSFKVFLPDENKYILTMSDNSGKKLFSQTTWGSCEMTIESYPAGIYFLDVVGGRSMKKVVIIKAK
jgi:hypothetical protein